MNMTLVEDGDCVCFKSLQHIHFLWLHADIYLCTFKLKIHKETVIERCKKVDLLLNWLKSRQELFNTPTLVGMQAELYVKDNTIALAPIKATRCCFHCSQFPASSSMKIWRFHIKSFRGLEIVSKGVRGRRRSEFVSYLQSTHINTYAGICTTTSYIIMSPHKPTRDLYSSETEMRLNVWIKDILA